MKKISIFINLLLLGVIGWQYYNCKKSKCPPLAECNSCLNCTTETTGYTFDHFKEVVKRYRTERWDNINANKFNSTTAGDNYDTLITKMASTDARSIWFSMDTLKQFICTIDKYNNKLTNKGTGIGVRIYYAVYDSTETNPSRMNRHTLFMVPTYLNANGSNVDYDPRESFVRQERTGKSALLSLGELASSPMLKLMMGPQNNTGTIQNNGELCPANCPNINTFSLIDQ